MVKQGDIIKVSFNTDSEQEQQGSYPAIVISNNEFNKRTKLAVVCPITNTDNRKCKVVEKAPSDILMKVTDIVTAEIEII